jgi:chromosome segregation ATPase
MASEIVRHLTPEEEELLRKREELAAVKAALAERELELTDFRSQLAVFQGRYMRQVGVLYAELDDWQARVAELQAKFDGSQSVRERAAQAREQARTTYEAAHGEASRAPDFQPSADLKALFREVAKRIHPDFAKGAEDEQRRTRAMAQANEAYSRGDAEALQRILNEYRDGSDSVPGEGIGAELIRLIRQISQAKNRLAAIEKELGELQQSEIALLRQDADAAQQQGRDLLADLATTTRAEIARTKKEYEVLSGRGTRHG